MAAHGALDGDHSATSGSTTSTPRRPDALKRTERYSLNLAWSPIPRLDLIAEYLWGRRINLDDQSGSAGQLQLGGTFRF